MRPTRAVGGTAPKSVDRVVWHHYGNSEENRTACKHCQFFPAPGKARGSQVSTELFGTTGGIQGKTGQRVSAADFSLAPRKVGDPQAMWPAGTTVRTGEPAAARGTLYEKKTAIAQGDQWLVNGESEGDSDVEVVPRTSVTAANQAAMRISSNNWSI